MNLTGHALARDGLGPDGRSLVTLATDTSTCWRVHLWERTDRWRAVATAAGPAGAPADCGPVRAAVAGDDRLVAVYAPNEGRARLLRRDGSRLVHEATIALEGAAAFADPPPGPNVAVGGDGRRVLLGAPNYGCWGQSDAMICGEAQLFEQGADGWRLRHAFRSPDPLAVGSTFGSAVALSADGRLVAVGGEGSPSGGSGAVHLYEEHEGRFELLARLGPERAGERLFGSAVAMTPDGSLIAIGGDSRVELWALGEDALTAVAELGPPDPDAGFFGAALALDARGEHLVVGAPGAPCADGNTFCGRAYLYGRATPDGRWRLVRRLDPPDPVPRASFGRRVGLSPDGTMLAVEGAAVAVSRR